MRVMRVVLTLTHSKNYVIFLAFLQDPDGPSVSVLAICYWKLAALLGPALDILLLKAARARVESLLSCMLEAPSLIVLLSDDVFPRLLTTGLRVMEF